MKGKALLVANYEELVQHEKLNLPKSNAKPELVEVEFYFNIHTVATAFVTIDKKIKCQIAGLTVLFVFEDYLWHNLKQYLGE